MRFVQGLFLFVVALVTGLAARAILIAYTWLWFIGPIFEVAPLTYIQAVGLSMFSVAVFLPWLAPRANAEFAQDGELAGFVRIAWEALGRAVITPLFILAIAWGWHTATLSSTYLAQWNVVPQ
jgi:hypothetical protein